MVAIIFFFGRMYHKTCLKLYVNCLSNAFKINPDFSLEGVPLLLYFIFSPGVCEAPVKCVM